MLLALGANKLGSRFGPVSGAREFHWAYLFLGLSEWVCAPIFKPYQVPSTLFEKNLLDTTKQIGLVFAFQKQ